MMPMLMMMMPMMMMIVTKKTPPKPCFESKVILKLRDRKQPRKVAEAFTKELIEKIQMVRDENDFSHISEDLGEFKSLKDIMKAEDNARLESVAADLHTPWENDRHKLRSLLETREETWAKVPVLDGLYGGKACVRPSDKKKLTSRKDDDPKFDAAKMHNARPLDEVISFNRCTLPVCSIDLIGWWKEGGKEEQPPIEPCEILRWTVWGAWGACDLKCGDKGKRIRKRECENKCMDPPEKNENDKCSPIEIKSRNISITNEDYTTCSFCPPEDQGQWSTWTEWTVKKQGKCGEAVILVSKRKCLSKGKADCEGKDHREWKQATMPCKPDKPEQGKNDKKEDDDNENKSGEDEGKDTDEETNDNEDKSKLETEDTKSKEEKGEEEDKESKEDNGEDEVKEQKQENDKSDQEDKENEDGESKQETEENKDEDQESKQDNGEEEDKDRKSKEVENDGTEEKESEQNKENEEDEESKKETDDEKAIESKQDEEDETEKSKEGEEDESKNEGDDDKKEDDAKEEDDKKEDDKKDDESKNEGDDDKKEDDEKEEDDKKEEDDEKEESDSKEKKKSDEADDY